MIKLTSEKDTYTMLCELEETKYLGARNYVSYTPESRVTIPIDPVGKTVYIHILDATGNPCLHGKDIYECVKKECVRGSIQIYCKIKMNNSNINTLKINKNKLDKFYNSLEPINNKFDNTNFNECTKLLFV